MKRQMLEWNENIAGSAAADWLMGLLSLFYFMGYGPEAPLPPSHFIPLVSLIPFQFSCPFFSIAAGKTSNPSLINWCVLFLSFVDSWIMGDEREGIDWVWWAGFAHNRRRQTAQLKKIYLFYGAGSKPFNNPFISSTNSNKRKLLFFICLIHSACWMKRANVK